MSISLPIFLALALIKGGDANEATRAAMVFLVAMALLVV